MATSLIEAHSLTITGVTANCGNDTLGIKAAQSICDAIEVPDGPDVLVIHCQEVHYKKQRAQLQQAIAAHANIDLVASSLMVTRTTIANLDVLAGHTGIATFVLYKKDKLQKVAFNSQETKEIRGENRNKGGYLNILSITDSAGHTHRIRTISGHLDSYSEKIRANDWQHLKQNSAFEAKTWEELVEKIPDVQVAGYDANIRNRLEESTKHPIDLWRQRDLDPCIAPLVLAPMGTTLYSSKSTFQTTRDVNVEDAKRKGYARGGSLDFVAVQNNTMSPMRPPDNIRYTEATLNLPEERGTHRDHRVIAGATILLRAVTPFARVQHYLIAELMFSAPKLAEEIRQLEDSAPNRELLRALHEHYLSPHGLEIETIPKTTPKGVTNISPWFEHHTLETFQKEQDEKKRFQTFCALFKASCKNHTNATGIQHMQKAMEKQQKNGTYDFKSLSTEMKRIAISRNTLWSRFHFFCAKPRDINVQAFYDTLENMDFPKDDAHLLNQKFKLLSDILITCFAPVGHTSLPKQVR